MPLAKFETLYWRAVATAPSFPPTVSLLSRARSLFSVFRCYPAGFGHQLMQIIVFSAQQRGFALNEPTTLNWCRSQLQQALPPDSEFLLSDTSRVMLLTQAVLKNVLLIRIAWHLLFRMQ